MDILARDRWLLESEGKMDILARDRWLQELIRRERWAAAAALILSYGEFTENQMIAYLDK